MAAIDRIEDFPQDEQLWWIRWVDHYHIPHKGTSTAAVEVLIEQLDTSLEQLRNVDLRYIFKGPENPKQKVVRVFSVFIPRLVIGTVFKNGIAVGTLPLVSEFFDVKDFFMSVLDIKQEISSKPDWWTYPYRVINRSDYQLKDFPDSKAVVVADSDVVLVIPCHEVFRTMYAPHSAIARALTSGPWEHTASKLFDLSQTGIRDDGRWQILLQREMKNNFAKILANLWLSEFGKAAANSIYTSALSYSGPSKIAVPIPFDVTKLKLNVRGVWLDGSPAKFLALQLTRMEWPIDIEKIISDRKNNSDVAEIQTECDLPQPYPPPSATPAEDDEGIITTNSTEDPAASSELTEFYAPEMAWDNEPELIKEPKLESFIYNGQRDNSGQSLLQGTSPGEEWYGESNSGSAAYSSERRDPSKRFSEVVRMLDRLKRCAYIMDWTPIPHPKPFLSVGSLPVWHFPQTIYETGKKKVRFSFLDRSTGRRRGALVCEIRYRKHLIYWLEIEVAPNGGGFRSMIFAAPRDVINSVTHRFIRIAAKYRGIWPDIDELLYETGATWAEAWQHSYVGKTANSDGHLNGTRALEAIARVSSRIDLSVSK